MEEKNCGRQKIARDFLNTHWSIILRQYRPVFLLKGNTIKCRVYDNGKRREATAYRDPKCNICVGMAVSFCQAANWAVPSGLI